MCQNSSFRDPFESNKNPWRSENRNSVDLQPYRRESLPWISWSFTGEKQFAQLQIIRFGSPSRDLAFFVFLVFVFPPQLAQLRFAFSIISHMARHVVNPGRSKKKGVGSLFGGKQTSKENVQNVFCWTENPGSSCLCLNTFRLAGSNFRLPTDSID